MTPSVPALVVMGVSAVGKSSVGRELARLTAAEFIDADDLHSAEAVEKMSAGHPLDDDDRWPWLDRVGQALAASGDHGCVVACSALKRRYRDVLRRHRPDVRFVQLDADPSRLEAQARSRAGHFMPAELLASQLAALEPLATDEHGITVRVDAGPDDLALRIAAELDLPAAPSP